jgi:hypothetical protein
MLHRAREQYSEPTYYNIKMHMMMPVRGGHMLHWYQRKEVNADWQCQKTTQSSEHYTQVAYAFPNFSFQLYIQPILALLMYGHSTINNAALQFNKQYDLNSWLVHGI